MKLSKRENLFINGLGMVSIRTHSLAKRITFRVNTGVLQVTKPVGVTHKETIKVINTMKDELVDFVSKNQPPFIDLQFKIDTPYFKLSIVEGDREKFLSRSELGEMKIIAPQGTEFKNNSLQKWLRKVIVEALRRNAKIILPPKLYSLSQRFGVAYKGVKINTSKGRWGSCSSEKNINLSAFLVLLPQHLIEYVLLHELSHTFHLNHSDKFWTQLDQFTNGRARELDLELKKHEMLNL